MLGALRATLGETAFRQAASQTLDHESLDNLLTLLDQHTSTTPEPRPGTASR